MRKIVFLITGLAYGGAEVQLLFLSKRLRERGWETHVVSMLSPQAIAEEFVAAGITVSSLHMHRGIPDPRAILYLRKTLQQVRPQILHSHMVHANLLARIVRPLSPIPILICTAQNIDEGGWRREIAYQFTDPLCDLTTQVSNAGLERYIHVGAVSRRKAIFIPNGVDSTLFRPDRESRETVRKAFGIEDSTFVWLAVGRFEPQKDYPTMISAFSKLHRLHPTSQLLIAGQGVLLAEMQHFAKELNLSDSIRFIGLRKDIAALLNGADAFVLSSAWEGLPMVLLEAASVGLPIVATDVGGNREVVRSNVNGYLFPSRDTDTLAKKMHLVMTLEPDKRMAMGREGRQLIETYFDLEIVVDQWEEIYLNFLKQRGIGFVS
jgi:glycosyltransferase involved in cell wall biosynthesis